MREFVKRIHLVGIGGLGMSGIAEGLLELGFQVSGSALDHGALARLPTGGPRRPHRPPAGQEDLRGAMGRSRGGRAEQW